MNSFNRIIQSAWALCDICWIFIKISIHIARRPLTCFCLFTYWKLLIGYRKLVNTHIWKPTAQNVTSPFAEDTSLSSKPDRRVLIVYTVYNQGAATDCTTNDVTQWLVVESGERVNLSADKPGCDALVDVGWLAQCIMALQWLGEENWESHKFVWVQSERPEGWERTSRETWGKSRNQQKA